MPNLDIKSSMTTPFSVTDHPHRRQNPLTGDWVLVSPHRSKRPWQGLSEADEQQASQNYEANCYLCPRNTRISGAVNDDYSSVFVFDNDFAALNLEPHEAPISTHPLFNIESAKGLARVICFSPDHSKSLPQMTDTELLAVVNCWIDQRNELKSRFTGSQLVENKGGIMGCSQPHPHGQLWASDFVPTEVSKKHHNQAGYYAQNGTPLLVDYLHNELELNERIVCENDTWAVVVPFWAAWPFETLLLPKKHFRRLDELHKTEQDDLAVIIKDITTRYDNLFNCSFPYSMGWHFAPYYKTEEDVEHWQVHASFYPPLLRSATIKKFMVGYEMLAEPQRDLTPEQAAQALRSQSTTHYSVSSEKKNDSSL